MRSILIARQYEEGAPVTEIMEEFECSRGTVLRHARNAGLPKRPKCFPISVREAVIEALEAGDAYKEIKNKWGVSEAYISKVAKAEGLNRYK